MLLLFSEFLKDLVGAGGMLSREHGVVCDDREGGICDGISYPLGLVLGILEGFDVIRVAFHVQMVLMNLILQHQHIKGMEATA